MPMPALMARIYDHSEVRGHVFDASLFLGATASMLEVRVDVDGDFVANLRAGGVVEHFGMPVDPGNLLLIGATAAGRPILGAPGCARRCPH